MILTEKIKVELNDVNRRFYKKMGYEVDGLESIDVKIEDIGKGRLIKVLAKCDLCNKEKIISLRCYYKNYNKYQTYTCSNKCAMFKNKKTNYERYGTEHQCRNEIIKNDIIKTKIERGLISTNIENFKDYRKKVNNLTRKNKKNLLETWNGFDYYDNEFIFDNFSLDTNHRDYPSIDHKISVLWGFNNGISAEEICDLKNLCFTKRRHNSSKNLKNEETYIKIRH